MARETQSCEKYGIRTAKQPKVVFTPPLSPKYTLGKDLKSIMDVNAGWNNFPMTLNNLIRLSTPIPKELTDLLKNSRLTRQDLGDALLAIIVNTKGVLQLIKNGRLLLSELSEVSINSVDELLKEEDIIILLSDGTLQLNQLMEIHSEYLEDGNNALGEFSFKKFYSLITDDCSEFRKLFNDLGLSINEIIKLFHDDYNMFCAFANDNAIAFFQEYGEDIDIDELIGIYRNNQELFYALINDEEDLLQNTSVEDFIEGYEQAQSEISEISEDDPYKGSCDPYDYLASKIKEDGCPDEFLKNNSFSGNDSSGDENYDENTCYNSYLDNEQIASDNDEIVDRFFYQLADQNEECYVSDDGSSELSGSSGYQSEYY